MIETLKNLITSQENQLSMTSPKDFKQQPEAVPTDAFYKDLMDKISWVEDLHSKMEVAVTSPAIGDTESVTESKGKLMKVDTS